MQYAIASPRSPRILGSMLVDVSATGRPGLQRCLPQRPLTVAKASRSVWTESNGSSAGERVFGLSAKVSNRIVARSADTGVPRRVRPLAGGSSP